MELNNQSFDTYLDQIFNIPDNNLQLFLYSESVSESCVRSEQLVPEENSGSQLDPQPGIVINGNHSSSDQPVNHQIPDSTPDLHSFQPEILDIPENFNFSKTRSSHDIYRSKFSTPKHTRNFSAQISSSNDQVLFSGTREIEYGNIQTKVISRTQSSRSKSTGLRTESLDQIIRPNLKRSKSVIQTSSEARNCKTYLGVDGFFDFSPKNDTFSSSKLRKI